MKVRFPEFLYVEQPALQTLQKLGYTYRSGEQEDERQTIDEVILRHRLQKAIKRLNPWMNDNNVQTAFLKITSVTGASLIEINREIWQNLRSSKLTIKQEGTINEEFRPVKFIDYENPDNNDFLVVNQLKFKGESQNSIPDLVVFINGLPIAVIECKSPSIPNAWDEAFNDLKYYQENSEKLFHYNMLCIGLWGDDGRYGAIGAPQKYFSVYKTKEDEAPEILGERPTQQAKLLYGLFQKQNVLDLIRHFVLFELEEGQLIKKIPRHQQIRATNKTIEKLKNGKGGVVWHTQGSGKSLTMAYIARKLQAQENGFNNPTIIILTDRKDLDGQITTTFRNVGFENVDHATSVVHLDQLLRNSYGSIITTTLQKFQEVDNLSTEVFDQTEEEELSSNKKVLKVIAENKLIKITKELIDGNWEETNRTEIELEPLSQKENLFVLVDEAHRSQYGFLAAFMRMVLPHAKFVAFTGTPISNEEKSTLGEFYGGSYIDVYTIKESVADGNTVELWYEMGVEQLEVKKKSLDKEFAEQFGDQSLEKQEVLKKEALRNYQMGKPRIIEICRHIIRHYGERIHKNGHKAMIVCSGRAAAIRYQKVLNELREEREHNFESKVIISLGSPKKDEIAREYYKAKNWNDRNPNKSRKPIWVTGPESVKQVTEDFKLPFRNNENQDQSGTKKFDNTAFLIVSDMLLTGYDVPIASCLYLDKGLKEHNLLQAIARVNRSRKGKSAGYIVDYYGIAEYLIQALEIFSGDLLASDLIRNLEEELPRLEMHHTKLVNFFRKIKVDLVYERDHFMEMAIPYLEPVDKRDSFKHLLKSFNTSLSVVLPDPRALKFQEDYKLFNELKLRAKNTYIEDEGLKISDDESRMLLGILDQHLEANGITNLLEEPISIFDTDRFKEELQNASPEAKELKMRKHIKYVIRVGLERNPDFYKPLAQRLEELLEQKESRRMDEAQLILSYQDEILNKISSATKEGKAKGFDTEAKLAVFDTIKALFENNAEQITKDILQLVSAEMGIIGWRVKDMVLNEMEIKIKRYFKSINLDRDDSKVKAKEIVKILKNNSDA